MCPRPRCGVLSRQIDPWSSPPNSITGQMSYKLSKRVISNIIIRCGAIEMTQCVKALAMGEAALHAHVHTLTYTTHK